MDVVMFEVTEKGGCVCRKDMMKRIYAYLTITMKDKNIALSIFDRAHNICNM